MSITNVGMTKLTLNGYKEDAIKILQTQISMLSDIESEILSKENESNTEDTKSEGILTSETCREFQKILNGEVHKLQKFDVVLAVVGTMKAGKSTTINAIVGREILPNRNRPMTSLPTLICHNKEQKIPKLTFNSKPINDFLIDVKIALGLCSIENASPEIVELIDFIEDNRLFSDSYNGETDIFDFLQRLNDLVRLAATINNIADDELLKFPYDSYQNIDALPMINVAFKLQDDFETDGRFMLLDTAGPNESGHKELLGLLREQLKRSSAVMLVLDYTQLNSEAEESIKNEIEAIPTIQKSRLFALVNKFDQESANADDAETTKKHIFNNLLKDKIDFEHIYPISARDAYLANRMESYLLENENKPDYKEGTWIEDFAKQVLGKRAEQKYEKMDAEEISEELGALIDDSRMSEPLREVILNMQRNAPYIAIQSALAGASGVFEKLHNFFNIRGHYAEKEKMTNEEIINLETAIKELKFQIKLLESKSLNIKDGFIDIKNNALKKIEWKEKESEIPKKIDIALNALFSEKLHTTDEEAKKAEEAVKENWGKLKKIKKLNEDSTNLVIAQEVKSATSDSTIAFSNTSDLDEFSKKVQGRVLFIGREINNIYDEIMKESVKDTTELTESLHKECNKLLDNLQDQFNKEGIKNIKVPSLDLQIKNNEENITKNFSIDSNSSTKTVTRYESGITGSAKRWFGSIFNKNWGTLKVDVTTYTVNKDKVTKELNLLLNNKVISPLREEIKNMISELLERNMLAIDDFNSTIKNSVEEMNNAIVQEKMPDLEEKKKYKKKIKELQKVSKDIEEDWDKLSDVFMVGKVDTQI